jgi:DNA-binding PadR family transcriptional regulator
VLVALKYIEMYLEIRYILIYIADMKEHRQAGGLGRDPDGHHHRGGRRHGRVFDYGELRLLILAMIGEQPRHGYELIKVIEERFGGSYTPSPGVIYPTLSWLVDIGYTDVKAEDAGRKRYQITPEGEAFLVANRGAADALLSRTVSERGGPPRNAPAPVVRSMENLKLALRMRLGQGSVDDDVLESIAAAIDAAARAVQRS